MSKYRKSLPQLDGGLFLTDGGLETTLVFHQQIDLPEFATFCLLKSEQGRARLEDYFRHYAEIARRFCYPATPVENTVTLAGEKRSYTIYDVTVEPGIDASGDDSPITLEFYAPRDVELAPVILVLPILNGQKHLVRPFATHFARHGYAAVIVDTVQRRTLLEDLITPEAAIRRSVVRHGRVLDWVETQPGLDASRIGVFGASLGGFNALYLAALDDRVRAVVPALVAGDIPYVMTHSDERRIVEAVEGARQSLSMTTEELEAYLSTKLETDLLAVAPYVDPSRVLMIVAKRDQAVPYEKQVELHEALGSPEVVTLPTGHVTTAGYIFYLRSRARQFFDRTLAGAGDSVALLPPDPCAPAER
jgi:pimeloyl-ACP methyl ester carboxylesterase